jgi:DNA primase
MKTVFETIKDRLPITEILSSYITVVQNGSQYKAKCPFHNERTASFYISPERGLYYCFGCGAKGDIFTFVEQFEGLDKKGALKLLAERAGVVLSNQAVSANNDIDGIYELLEKATNIYQDILKKDNSANEYLEKRGITKETIESFRIGYAPDEWRTIESVCKNDVEKSFAIRAGLTKKTENKVYDRFRKRITFPLTDSSGRVIGFSGRSFPTDDQSPKYINSPETEVFQKSKTLFGFDKAKFHIKKHNFSILVEGQIDLVISHQAGFKNTVASSGTAVSEDAALDHFSNLSILSRLSSNIFLAFDGDKAGQKAMDRVALVALSLGMNPKVVVLPEGVDPADYIRENGADTWKERLKESKHFIDHHLSLIRKESLSPHIFVQNIKEKLFPFLVRVSSPMERNIYINNISNETGMSANTISEELSKVNKVVLKSDIKTNTQILKNETTSYERLIALRKHFGSENIEKIADSLDSFSIGDVIFSTSPVPEDRLERALIVVEKEYGSLKQSDKELVCKELVELIKNEFLIYNKKIYSQKLTQAQTKEDEESIMIILEQIHKRLTNS